MYSSDLKIICLESEAFYKLINEVVNRLKLSEKESSKDQWIDDKEAMNILNIGKTTLSKYRSEGLIRFSQIGKKVILYDRLSLLEFIEKNVKDL